MRPRFGGTLQLVLPVAPHDIQPQRGGMVLFIFIVYEPKSAGVWFLPFNQALHSDISGHGELINTA